MPEQVHILFVDDDEDDHFFFTRALEDVSMSTALTTMRGGEKLMEYLADAIRLPDVIFLDLNMPGMDGTECLETIRSKIEWAHIPVIIYSTSFDEVIADILYQKGANYYLQKPNFSDMACAINKTLKIIANSPERPMREKFVINFLDGNIVEDLPSELPF